MGYSARYHAASLAAVFLALAVGILIGVGFASDLVSGTADDLEQSLGEDLDETRARVDALESELRGEREFERAIYPAVVGRVLRGEQIALIGLGGLGPEVTGDIERALGPTGGDIGQVAVVAQPGDPEKLSRLTEGRHAREVQRGDPVAIGELATDAARVLGRGGPRFDELRGTLLGRYSGQAEGTDAVILVRDRPEGLEDEEAAVTDALEDGLLSGFRSLGIPVVGVERSDADPSSVGFYADRGLSTVDSVDRVSGQVALVYALCGASGHFGIKESADALLPELGGQRCSSTSSPGLPSAGERSEQGE